MTLQELRRERLVDINRVHFCSKNEIGLLQNRLTRTNKLLQVSLDSQGDVIERTVLHLSLARLRLSLGEMRTRS